LAGESRSTKSHEMT